MSTDEKEGLLDREKKKEKKPSKQEEEEEDGDEEEEEEDDEDEDDEEEEYPQYYPDLNEEDVDNAPTEFLCPITRQIMLDPVVASDGMSYERLAVTRWLLQNSISPGNINFLLSSRLNELESTRS